MRSKTGCRTCWKKGYIPCDKVREATSIAMEYAADDWGIALMAKKMGKTEDYQNYLKRGKYYTQYFDKDINFIRPKMMMAAGVRRTIRSSPYIA